MEKHEEILSAAYDDALENLSVDSRWADLSDLVKRGVEFVIDKSYAYTAVYTALLTLLCHKVYDPLQDIRYHQKKMKQGFSGRTVDTKFVTPFLRNHDFPAMAESAWLTRSIETSAPFMLDFPGEFKDKKLKSNFLFLINEIQEKGTNAYEVLTYALKLLIRQREESKIDLAKPHNLSISEIVSLLRLHFTFNYTCQGAARLPVLAVYAAYECMMSEVSRFQDKVLCPLEFHTSADSRSGQIGDIQINRKDGSAFEGVEVKHLIEITPDLISQAYHKFSVFRTDRYYLLTTGDMSKADMAGINKEIEQIRRCHGCQVIVNGVYSSLQYYLRLLQDPSLFIDKYVELLKIDKSVKYPHQSIWNEITKQPRGEELHL